MMLSEQQSMPIPQKPMWQETLEVIKHVDTIGVLTKSKAIEDMLPFNSQETRARRSRAMATRFRRIEPQILKGFIELGQAGLPTDLTESLWRILFCSVESIFTKTYLDIVWPREPGSTIKRDEIKSYLQSSIAVKRTELYKLIMDSLQQTGYLLPQDKNDLYIVGFGNLEDALLVATHLLMAQSPRTIKISEIESSDYWKFLGYRKFDHVRVAFRTAEAKGMIMRYAKADHLEQITTRFSWTELLDKMRPQA